MGIEEGLFALGDLIFSSVAGGGAEAAAGAGAAAATDIGAGAAATDLAGGAAAAGGAGTLGTGAADTAAATLGTAGTAGTTAVPNVLGQVTPLGDLGAEGAGATGSLTGSPIGGGDAAMGLGGPTSSAIGPFDTTVTPAADTLPTATSADLGGSAAPFSSSLPEGFDASAATGGFSPTQQASALGADTGTVYGAGSDLTTGGVSGAMGDSGILGSGIGWKDALKYGVPLAGLGATLLRGQQPIPGEARRMDQIANAEGNMATEFLKLGTAGQITSAQQAQIDIFKQNATNALRQQYANAGRNPDTDSGYLYGVQQIDQQAAAMRQQYIDALIKEGLAAAGGATQALNQVAQMQIAEDRNFQQSIGDAMKAFGYVMGAGNSTGLNIKVT